MLFMICPIDSCLLVYERDSLLNLLGEIEDLFEIDSKSLGGPRTVQHTMDTVEDRPLRSRSYRVSQTERYVMPKQVNHMLH